MNRIPAIRFKGFTDPWEQRKLGELCEINSGRDYKHLGEGTIPVYGTGGYMLSVDEALSYDRDAVGIGRKGTIDKPYKLRAPFWTVDTLFYCIPENAVDLGFLEGLFLNVDWASKDESTGLPSLSKTIISDVDVLVPETGEQVAISGVLASLDNLITLHQRKHDQLSVLKKGLLEKMFPRDGALVPEIRFKGFTDPWELRKFSEVFSFLRNNTLSRAELSDSEGETRDVHYGDILVKFGEVIDVRRDELPRIASDALAGGLSCQPLSNGDVIIADTAEDEAVGKCSELRGCGDYPIVSGLHTMACRPEFEFAPGYLGYYMNSPAFHDQLLPLMQGIKVISVSKGAISDTDVRFPSLPEQKAIGASLTELDNLITLHLREPLA